MTKKSTAERIRDAVSGVAPQLARALGGPLAETAAGMLAEVFLGRGEAEEGELLDAVLAAAPERLAALKLAEVEFRQAVLSAAGEAERIAAEDRADARAREVALKDRVPGALAVVVLAGFFSVLGVMLFVDVPDGAETEFSIMLGALATMSAAVMNYYFGSSASSREKTRMLRDTSPLR
ncbi:hypothetical protein [Parvularcula lutaonensis]|uniref:Holin of 3TMs, for gene-transfer release n=1 Tax=Parvularcula lutaonensis TaxID=491923 RepID=A0ABV7MEE6_9PROT|nr:hypothetical protein [Parvularcula lutaonensis]GGY52560.1 hypothetical protein GCM10007148_22150 [Parvularcula lutaonensis]